MIYQITLYDGGWEKLPTEKAVKNLMRHRFKDSQNIQFQGHDEESGAIVIEVELPDSYFNDYWREQELVTDRLYRCFYSLGPEYESMVEITPI